MTDPAPYKAGWEVHRDSLLTIYAALVATPAVVVRRPEEWSKRHDQIT